MFRRKLTWQLVFGYLCVMILPLVIATWYTSSLYKRFYIDHTVAAEKTHAFLIGKDLAPLIANRDFALVDTLCKRLARNIGMRITVILPSGRVIGDSERNPDSMENHRYRPEIIDALVGKIGVATRLSATLHCEMTYVASPLTNNDTLLAVVRTAVPLASITIALANYYKKIALVSVFMALGAMFLAFVLSRRIILPVRELEAGAQRFARGEFSKKIVVPPIEELKHLAIALNDMADQLHDRIQTITRQRNEQETVLAGMSEAVIAVDREERILFVNASAAHLFGISGASVQGRLLGEMVRNSSIQRFVRGVIENELPLENDIAFPSGDDKKNHDRFLQVHGTVLRDAGNVALGALLVISDVTRLRRLETVRKEFVANVSHELRTPLTTIKGFVETLLTSALDTKEDARRFLTIIAEHVDRLATLIDDLMSLAVIEREEETKSLLFEERNIGEAVHAAVSGFGAAAAAKQIAIVVSGDTGITLPLNTALIEQAIGNLIDNAIKYSESDTEVGIVIAKSNGELTIAVRDHGIGIPAEHIDRLFERFYRVDKARSRKAGGTGLGLSIVKHIAAIHGGRVAVESEVGSGSTFSIVLPLVPVKTAGNQGNTP